MSIHRPYRGVTADVRRERRREALLEAALDLLGSDTADISVRGVCAGAGLTQRYFYESFTNLDELQLALFHQIADEIALEGAAALAAHAPVNLYDACRTAFEGAYSVFQTDPRKARATQIVSSTAEGLAGARRRIVASYTEAMRGFLGKEFGSGLDSERGQVALLYAVGGALEVTDAVLNGDVALSEEELGDIVGSLLAASVRSVASHDGSGA